MFAFFAFRDEPVRARRRRIEATARRRREIVPVSGPRIEQHDRRCVADPPRRVFRSESTDLDVVEQASTLVDTLAATIEHAALAGDGGCQRESDPAPARGGNVPVQMTVESTQLGRLRVRRAEILDCAERHGARNVRVFGSAARGEEQQDSDVDLLVEMQPGRSLLDLVGLWQDLEDLLEAHVDVLSDRGVSPHLREQIIADAVAL